MLRDGLLDIANLGSLSLCSMICQPYNQYNTCRSPSAATALMTPYELDAEIISVEYLYRGLMNVIHW